jgi:hypothetical protein
MKELFNLKYKLALVLLSLALYSFLFAKAGHSAPVRESKPAVLITGTAGYCGYNIAKQLQDAGFEVNTFIGNLTWEKAKQYNVIVVAGLGQCNGDMSLSEANKNTIAVLQRFMEAGGGILVIPHYIQTLDHIPPQETFLKQYGLTPLFAELISDKESSTIGTAWNIRYANTSEIMESPITQGIKSLWYPAPPDRFGGQSHSVACKVDNNWTVAVAGSSTASTLVLPLSDESRLLPGTIQKNPSLVAFRLVGDGRMVYYGVAHNYLLNEVAATTLEGIVLNKGLKGIPSDGFKLFTNSLSWLASSSLDKDILGGALMDTSLVTNPYKVKFEICYPWTGKPVFPKPGSEKQGVIGARTNYSSGKATVDEWITKAKAQGLSYLVFLEEFAKLSAEDFKKLRDDCKRLSSPDFLAVPGFTIDDEIGNHYFYFGTTFEYPDKTRFLTGDGKAFRSRSSGSDAKGQLALTTLEYTYSSGGFKLMAGNYLFNHDAAPFSDWFSDYQAIGVITCKNGVLQEDAMIDYFKINASGQDPLPMAIDLMDEPSKLAKSPWRVVIKLPNKFDNGINKPIDERITLEEFINSWHFNDYWFSDNPNDIYITSGPQIDYLGYAGSRRYPAESNGDFVWQNYRWVVRGDVSSSFGLKSVEIYDGTKLFRRFLPSGRNKYSFSLDLNHSQQHNFILVVTDLNGKRAISRELTDHNDRCDERMCADRNNQLPESRVINSNGELLKMGGNQMLGTPCKRSGNNVSPSGTFKNDGRLGAPAFDGAAWGEPQVFRNFKFIGTLKPVTIPNVVEAVRVLNSGDLNSGEAHYQHIFNDNVPSLNPWISLWSAYPADSVNIKQRHTYFQIDPDSPLAVFLWQFDISLLNDIPNEGFNLAVMIPDQSKLWALRGSDSKVYGGNWEESPISPERILNVPFNRNAYATFNNSPLGGAIVFPLTDGMEASLSLPASGKYNFSLVPSASPQRKGEHAKAELLLVGIPRPTEYTKNIPSASNEIAELFYRDFGLDGGETGYSLLPYAGKVISRRYILKIDGSKEQAFSGTISGKLISSLPIAVSGLHDNWSAFLFDRNLKKARPIAVGENTAWVVVPVRGLNDFFIGHPITADNNDLIIQVTQSAENKWTVEVHNPTDKEIITTLSINSFFNPLIGKKIQGRITIQAGSSITNEW